jgi:CheY-like chemotaxis protein
MGLILWIDQNTFATSLLEKVFKRKELSFYTVAAANDFVYLVDDLKPELLVLDGMTANLFKDELKAQYESSESLRSLPVVFVDEVPELPFITNKVGVLNRPFDPFEVPQLLQNLISRN